MSRVAIRPARLDDLGLIIEMLASDSLGSHDDTADPELFDVYRKAFEQICASSAEQIYVAEWDGVVAGTFKTVLLTSLRSRGSRRMLVEAVQVRPDLQGKGIGHEMMQFCIGLGRQAGVKTLELTTNKLRVDAHRFYERIGFKQTHYGYKLRLK
ncbi:hypothetical protein COL154_014368 [Colletotrichum chrysophilum]|nr:hypothetical protein COL154_014368 [Colletotrichum chrysophilum]